MQLAKLISTYEQKEKKAFKAGQIAQLQVLQKQSAKDVAIYSYWSIRNLQKIYRILAEKSVDDKYSQLMRNFAQEKAEHADLVLHVLEQHKLLPEGIPPSKANATKLRGELESTGHNIPAHFYLLVLASLENLALQMIPQLVTDEVKPAIEGIIDQNSFHHITANVLFSRLHKHHRLFGDNEIRAAHSKAYINITNPIFFGIIALLAQGRAAVVKAGANKRKVDKTFRDFLLSGTNSLDFKSDLTYGTLSVYMQMLCTDSNQFV